MFMRGANIHSFQGTRETISAARKKRARAYQDLHRAESVPLPPVETGQCELTRQEASQRSAKLASLCGITLVASIVLGGGTRSGFLSDAILQLLAIPVLLLAIWSFHCYGAAARLRGGLAFCATFALIPILQLVPLPPILLSALPGHELIAESYSLIGRPLPWWAVSVAPHATWLGLVSLIVPLGIFLATIQLRRRERRFLSLVALGVGVFSVFLGLLQIAQGPGSPLRFFSFTNVTEAVGFFANRNHFAALLYSLILFAAAWTVHIAGRLPWPTSRMAHDTPLTLALFAGLAVMVILIAGQMMARSRAGLALTILGLLGIWALALRNRDGGTGLALGRILGGAIGLAVVLGLQFSLYRVLDRFGADPLADARIPFALTTIEAAWSYMPFGSGVGTFVPVYQVFENVQDAHRAYANRAHNDILEVWLEAGAPALLMMGVFLIWLIRRTMVLWRAVSEPGGEIDLLLSRAASIVLVLLSVHSLVDYPLRTASLMAFFAFTAALLFDPPDDPEPAATTRPRPSRKTPSPRLHLNSNAAPSIQQCNQNWSDIEWPEAWRTPPK